LPLPVLVALFWPHNPTHDGAVILQGIEPAEVDGVARRIAELERIPLLATTISAEDLATVLNHR